MKPITRGYIHLVAFFIAIGACAILIFQSHGVRAVTANSIYSFTLIGMYGVSSLYHRPMWSRRNYLLMRRIDHAAIFVFIAGSATPICLLGLKNESGWHLLLSMLIIAAIGIILSIFWTHVSKWIRACLYVAFGWFALPYLPEIKSALGAVNTNLLISGGVIYTVGALIYAIKRPDPLPHIFGYHEIFHTFVVIASAIFFILIFNLTQA